MTMQRKTDRTWCPSCGRWWPHAFVCERCAPGQPVMTRAEARLDQVCGWVVYGLCLVMAVIILVGAIRGVF